MLTNRHTRNTRNNGEAEGRKGWRQGTCSLTLAHSSILLLLCGLLVYLLPSSVCVRVREWTVFVCVCVCVFCVQRQVFVRVCAINLSASIRAVELLIDPPRARVRPTLHRLFCVCNVIVVLLVVLRNPTSLLMCPPLSQVRVADATRTHVVARARCSACSSILVPSLVQRQHRLTVHLSCAYTRSFNCSNVHFRR